MKKEIEKIEFIPTSFGVPEYGTECVVKINGLFATATYGFNDKWYNVNYVDGFEQSDVECWLAITDLYCVPLFNAPFH